MALAGGLEWVLARAAHLAREGNLRLACHLVEFTVLAQPGSADARPHPQPPGPRHDRG